MHKGHYVVDLIIVSPKGCKGGKQGALPLYRGHCGGGDKFQRFLGKLSKILLEMQISKTIKFVVIYWDIKCQKVLSKADNQCAV